MEIVPVPELTEAPFPIETPSNSPRVVPAAFPERVMPPAVVVMLVLSASERFRAVVREISPVPLAERWAFEVARVIEPNAFVVKFLSGAIMMELLIMTSAPVVKERFWP